MSGTLAHCCPPICVSTELLLWVCSALALSADGAILAVSAQGGSMEDVFVFHYSNAQWLEVQVRTCRHLSRIEYIRAECRVTGSCRRGANRCCLDPAGTASSGSLWPLAAMPCIWLSLRGHRTRFGYVPCMYYTSQLLRRYVLISVLHDVAENRLCVQATWQLHTGQEPD